MVRPRCTYRARRRPPTHLLGPPHWRAPHVAEVARSHGSCPDTTWAPVTGVIPTVRHFHAGDWASSNPALAISCGSCGTTSVNASQTATASPACCGPLQISPPGKPGDPRTSLRVHPRCAGDTTKRLTAHTEHDSLPSLRSYHPGRHQGITGPGPVREVAWVLRDEAFPHDSRFAAWP